LIYAIGNLFFREHLMW